MTKKKLTISQIERYLSKAAWILKRLVDASYLKVYILPLLFFKHLSDVYVEEYWQAYKITRGDVEHASLSEFYRLEIPNSCHGNNFRKTITNFGLAIKKGLQGIELFNKEVKPDILGYT